MNIGIDIDGVLTNIREFSLKQGIKYCEENQVGRLVDPDAYDTEKAFNWDAKTDLDFWTKNIFLYAETNPAIPKAAENIQKLKQNKHTIYIITARWLASGEIKQEAEAQNKEKMRTTVKNWLAKHNIYYDEIIFSGEDKSHHILNHHIDVMIEDSPNNLRNLSRFTQMICYDWPYNQEITDNNIYRCHNWDEIYQTIQKISKEKESKND